jgi:cellulose synthase/poly-beta-1,6-N-acetylglucosamine synthase-like glycosyltransferase
MNVLDVVLLVGAALLLVPALVFAFEVALACWPGTLRDAVPPGARRPALAVLVPAHNEALGITATVTDLCRQLAPADRLLVVADNCVDDTAELARAAGADVLERHDATRRGKGFALDAGVRHLAATGAPEVVVIIDADCQAADGALDKLARAALATGRPAQALYLMEPAAATGSEAVGPGAQLSSFAWQVKNGVRPLGLARAGLPCPLFGTGMAFPWVVIVNAPLASGHIVEDMQLGVDLTLAGHAPLFVPQARVRSRFAASQGGQDAQRRRWEHGHLDTLVNGVPRLIATALKRAQPASLAMALDLAVPPLALLVLLLSLMLFVCGGWAALGGTPAAAWACALALAAVGVAVLAAWVRFGRESISARTLVAAPWYAVRKVSIYLRFIVARQTQWVRSQRDGEG